MFLKKAKEDAIFLRSCAFGKEPGSANLTNLHKNHLNLLIGKSAKSTGLTNNFMDIELADNFKYLSRLKT